MNNETIDWTKMAVPRADHYDTDTVLHLATTGTSPLRNTPHVRRTADGFPTFCDGTVALRPYTGLVFSSKNIVPAPPDHPHPEIAASLLSSWPEAYAQFKTLMDTVHPYTDLPQSKMGTFAFGSSSHSFERDFGSIHVTIDDPIGMAQAMIHEMAHQKLRAMGISIETARHLITNNPSDRFSSPIRKDRPRPMTAVFHAQYSFMHVTALDLYLFKSAETTSDRVRILMLLARNATRMQAGYEEIAQNIRTDQNGALFVTAFMSWSDEVLREATEVLNANGYGNS